ncbi:VanZ family protein [Wansuia hejianensis]|uniref:VanZ family protein n=1 Tax=Wansuia hejianensis TaxID=2763667 RepID=A0A926EX09_9FIRM|nr:VanZ family protein [Wansuia hejianensis]MBC8590045.1 VanZ family protein [Wansuia hejianensis]
MRIHDILEIIKTNFYIGLIGVIGLGVLWLIGYFFIYRKLLSGKKKPNKKQLILGCAFIGYIIMVIGVTFLNRRSHFKGSINLNFLSSYRQAWNTFSLISWQFLILNIFMLIPLGIMLPLIHKKFYDIRWTFGVALSFTLFIECLQLITGFGIFELDDIFNNTLGALIGYGITMSILTILKHKEGKILKVMGYLSPLILTITIFGCIFIYYDLQEFGNLSVAYNYKKNMKDVNIVLNRKLSEERIEYPIYQAPRYNKDSANAFVIGFLENQDIDTSNIEIDPYNNSAIYWIRGEPSYNIWMEYLDGSYRYSDFSSFDEDMEPTNIDEDSLLKELSNLGIQIPAKAVFNNQDIGRYEWIVEKEITEDFLTEGSLSCSYYNDNTIKEINNNLITYTKIKDVPIKSEKEAYEELRSGKFNLFPSGNSIKSININNIELDYHLDSKGYYQPVYSFDSVIDDKEFKIIIPALL